MNYILDPLFFLLGVKKSYKEYKQHLSGDMESLWNSIVKVMEFFGGSGEIQQIFAVK